VLHWSYAFLQWLVAVMQVLKLPDGILHSSVRVNPKKVGHGNAWITENLEPSPGRAHLADEIKKNLTKFVAPHKVSYS
jgi:hypothetical protein